MERRAEICIAWALCAVVVLARIHGSEGSMSYVGTEYPSKLIHKLPFSRWIAVALTSRSSSNGLYVKVHSSRMLAPYMLGPNGPDKKGDDVSPSPEISSIVPPIRQKAPSLAYHGKLPTMNVPSPAPFPKGISLHPPMELPRKSKSSPPKAQRVFSAMQPSSPPDNVSNKHKWPRARSPSTESQSPNVPVRAADGISPSNSIPPLPQTRKRMPEDGLRGTTPSSNAPSAMPLVPVSSPPSELLPKSPATYPSISRLPPSVTRHAPHTETSQRPAVSPTSSTSPNMDGKRDGTPIAAPPKEISNHLPPVYHTHIRGLFPVLGPVPHEAKMPPNKKFAPFTSHPQSPVARKNKSPTPAPAPAPTPAISYHHHNARKHVRSPSSAPSYLFPPSPHQGPTPFPAPLLTPTVLPKNMRRHHTPPPFILGPSLPAIQSPSSSTGTKGIPAPSPLLMAPYSANEWPIQSPVPSHSGSFSRKARAPVPQPFRALPPPPPNFDCTPLGCSEPLTNSPPGSPCACVLPMKVELRLGVALYTFFPLVSELAQEIAGGIFMKQSQVRIMGANAASEQPEKTLVLIDLVPLGQKFDNTTAFLTYEKFWHKQVGIKTSYFGDYNVLYVLYPGLPPSPPMPPSNINMDDGALGNDNNSRTMQPLGVDVRKRKEKLSSSMIIIIILSSVIASVLCAGAAWFLLFKLKQRDHTCLHVPTPRTSVPPFAKASGTGPTIFGSGPSSASRSFSSSIIAYTGSAKTFGVGEIERATNKFDYSRIIGEGGFGRVFQGTLEDGTRVAVKVLKRDDQQGGREFLAEVEMLSRLHHRNLVKLIGICTEVHLRCLVYELISNGSVESHLHGVDKETSPLDWGARMKIALGSARALAYLHEDSSPPVIHRDFKSSNILLEHDFTPKVSDFGLARTALDEGTEHISTRVMGTFGYVAPEYAMTGHLLVKSDVYSYGVVLLELLTGRKPVDMLQPPGQENLVTWAHPLLTSKEGLETIIDQALGHNFPFDSVAKVAAIASMCVQPEVSHRPFMGEVVQALKLVCNENDEPRGSGSCSFEDLPAQDTELRISTGLGIEADRALSASDIFSTSARFTREASGSFRRHSSSGPLRTRSGQFWRRMRGLSQGSMSEEHGLALRYIEGGARWS